MVSLHEIKKLEKNWYKKAEKCKKIIKNLPINDYEIYINTIKVYEKEKIIPHTIFLFDLKIKETLDFYFKIYSIKNVKEIEYTPLMCVIQKFFTIKPMINGLIENYSNEEILKTFEKYKKIFNSIEKDLINLNKKINGKMQFYVTDKNYTNECYINFTIQKEIPLNLSKYLKGTFLMKKLEEIDYMFYKKNYNIWAEILLELKH